jgi:hypothetical protein
MTANSCTCIPFTEFHIFEKTITFSSVLGKFYKFIICKGIHKVRLFLHQPDSCGPGVGAKIQIGYACTNMREKMMEDMAVNFKVTWSPMST